MEEKPTEDQMATIYSCIRYGDSIRTACKILDIPVKQYLLWKKKADKAKRKKAWDVRLNDEEAACIKLEELIKSADVRRRHE